VADGAGGRKDPVFSPETPLQPTDVRMGVKLGLSYLSLKLSGDDEGLGVTRGLSVRRDGENREKDENCSHQVSLRVPRTEC
jgi:hypothetical protein